MLGMQDDISDVELKQRWRLYWIHTIFEFSNVELQKTSNSFEEFLSSYFDTLSLFKGYTKAIEYENVTKEEAQNAERFHVLVSLYDAPSDKIGDILKDPEWLEIVKEANTFWNYLKKNVQSQREIDLINKLEKSL